MQKNKIIGALALMLLGSSPSFAAENSNTNFESTATIENTCLIEADDVNFGQVYAPLTQQGTKSEMRVLCSKGTSYTVDLNYGGNFVNSNSSTSGDIFEARLAFHTIESYSEQHSGYRFYKNGEPIDGGTPYNLPSNGNYINNLNNDKNRGNIICYAANGNSPTQILFRTDLSASTIGLSVGAGTFNDIWGLCDATTSRLNMGTFNTMSGNIATNTHGAMIGAMKGNSLAYQITLPDDISKPWISNVNSYQAQATGEFDKIEVNARIIPGSSTSLYPAQDSYFDTVTAVIAY